MGEGVKYNISKFLSFLFSVLPFHYFEMSAVFPVEDGGASYKSDYFDVSSLLRRNTNDVRGWENCCWKRVCESGIRKGMKKCRMVAFSSTLNFW